MVGSVNRRVHGRAYLAFVGLHLVGSISGGVIAVLIARSFAASLGLQPSSATAAVIAMLLATVAIASDHELARFRIPSTNQQVPAGWRHTMPSVVWVPSFGVILGFTFFTKFTSAAVPAALIGVGLMTDGAVVAALAGAAYGGTRGMAVVAAPVLNADASEMYALLNRAWIGTFGIGLVLVASLFLRGR